MRNFTFVDLFAGIGGFHHALGRIGGKCVLAVEQDKNCQAVYRAAFPRTPLQDDIRALTRDSAGRDLAHEEVDRIVPDHDVLCAGFPCQPFSKSGYQLGVRDRTRGTLFFDVMTIVLAKRPRFVMLENVRNLAGPRHASTWTTIIESLREAGYQVASEPLVLSPHLLSKELGGAPQVRDRVFILAHKVEGLGPLKIVEPLAGRQPSDGWDPDRWKIEEHLQPDSEIQDIERYQLRGEEVGWIDAWQDFVANVPADSLPGFPIWFDAFHVKPRNMAGAPEWKRVILRKNSEFYMLDKNREFIDEWRKKKWGSLEQTVSEFPPSRRKFEWQARKSQPFQEDRNLWDLALHMRPSGIRVKPLTYLPALVAINQTSIIGPRRRRITPIEAARLQGIPPDFFWTAGVSESTAYKQLGNAVNVGVVSYLVQILFADADRAVIAA